MFRKVLCIVLLFWVIPVLVEAAAPYGDSTAITGVIWDATSYSEDALGSDNFAVTWSDDGDQYLVWGDGGGFHGTSNDCRVSLGLSTISGTLAAYQADEDGNTEDVWGRTQADPYSTNFGPWSAGCGATNPSQWGGKSYGIISINGDLYMWWGPGSGAESFAETRLLKSTNHGASWTKSTWNLVDDDKTLIMPTILNFGQDNASARDSYVYHYFIRCGGDPVGDTSCDSDQPDPPYGLIIQGSPTGYIDLARVLVTDMENNFNTLDDKFEWFTGLDGNDDPTWGTAGDESVRTAVFTDAAGVGWNASVSYNIGLDRYILITEHTSSQVGNMGIFDAPEPWGPWTTVAYYTEPSDFQDAIGVGGDVGSKAFFWNMSQKWTSGTDFALIWTGGGSGSIDDSFNVIEGTFTSPIHTASDNCDSDPSIEITEFDCFKFTKKGKRIDKTESCVVDVSGDTITILDSGGVADNIKWTVYATDGCGNVAVSECAVVVVNPGNKPLLPKDIFSKS